MEEKRIGLNIVFEENEEDCFFDESLNCYYGIEDERVECSPLDLLTAASIGNIPYLKWILHSSKVNVDKKNEGGWTPLLYAVFYGHEEVVKLLLSCGAYLHSTNLQGENALIIATKCGYESLVNCLLKAGSILEKRDNKNYTALMHSIFCRHITITLSLLEHGANPNTCDRKTGRTPLMYACMYGDSDLVYNFLHRGAHHGFVSNLRETADRIAAKAGHAHIVKMINEWTKTPSILDGPQTFDARLTRVKKSDDANKAREIVPIIITAGIGRKMQLFEKYSYIYGANVNLQSLSKCAQNPQFTRHGTLLH